MHMYVCFTIAFCGCATQGCFARLLPFLVTVVFASAANYKKLACLQQTKRAAAMSAFFAFPCSAPSAPNLPSQLLALTDRPVIRSNLVRLESPMSSGMGFGQTNVYLLQVVPLIGFLQEHKFVCENQQTFIAAII